MEGDHLLGVTAFWACDLTDAALHLKAAVAAYHAQNRREHVLRYAQDPKAICLTRLALTYWLLGDRDAAVLARDEGLAVAEECGHPYSLAVCLIFASLLALDMRDAPAVRRFVNRANEIAPVGAFQVEDVLVALDAYLKVLSGGVADGIATIRTILARAPADQAAPGLHSALLRILLAACEAAGADGVGAAADELVSLTNSLVWRPESERFRARVRLGRESANA